MYIELKDYRDYHSASVPREVESVCFTVVSDETSFETREQLAAAAALALSKLWKGNSIGEQVNQDSDQAIQGD